MNSILEDSSLDVSDLGGSYSGEIEVDDLRVNNKITKRESTYPPKARTCCFGALCLPWTALPIASATVSPLKRLGTLHLSMS